MISPALGPARDAQPSVQLDPRFPVIPVRALVNNATKSFLECQRDMIERFETGELDLKSAQLEIERFWVGCLRQAVIEGDIDNGSVMAGQSVGMVEREQPAAEILEEFVAQAVAAIAARDDVRT